MLDHDQTDQTDAASGDTDAADDASSAAQRDTTAGGSRRRRAAGRPAGPPVVAFSAAEPVLPEPDVTASDNPPEPAVAGARAAEGGPPAAALFQAPDPEVARSRRRAASRPAGQPSAARTAGSPEPTDGIDGSDSAKSAAAVDTYTADGADPAQESGRDATGPSQSPEQPADQPTDQPAEQPTDQSTEQQTEQTSARRRRRRGGRRRRKSGGDDSGSSDRGRDTGGTSADRTRDKTGDKSSAKAGDRSAEQQDGDRSRTEDTSDTDRGTGAGGASTEEPRADEGVASAADDDPTADTGTSSSSRRRRRRRRRGEEAGTSEDDPANTTVRVRERRAAEDEISSVRGSTRLEAKKQRRREGRDAGRRRAPVISEAEFLARREAVDREMVVRRRGDLTQMAVLEDNILVEHYVARGSQTSIIGNVYLGRVQNVLPSMEAAFVDIGKGRNAVLYAGEVDWKALGGEGKPRRIEEVLSSGQSVLVQVTKDPVGHKGARLTSQVSLPGRFLVYVPGGHTSGISRKLPDTERSRLKTLLKDIVPRAAGVIVRTAAEGASEEQLTRDVAALTARWDDITRKATGQGPKLLYAEPDLMIKVVRDLYNEDFKGLTVQGGDAWEDVSSYVEHVAPDLGERLQRWDSDAHEGQDVFAAYRLDEQIARGLDRKVWLPSGGSLVIDRTEAMTVVDVNTGKFTGSGGNLEETVTKNNLEAAEEMVRQLRLRDIGGIIVIDFIDMVLEDNRDLVLRRLAECLGRDRTRHQVAEVTSLGLVQMTRKRIGIGLLEAFSEPCTCCQGRGLHVRSEPVEEQPENDGRRGSERSQSRGGRSRSSDGEGAGDTSTSRSDSDGSVDGDGEDRGKDGGSKPRPRPLPRPPEPKGLVPPEPSGSVPPEPSVETTEDASAVTEATGTEATGTDSVSTDAAVADATGTDAAVSDTDTRADTDAPSPAAVGEPDVVPAAGESSVPPEAAPPAGEAKPKRRRASRAKAAPAPAEPAEPEEAPGVHERAGQPRGAEAVPVDAADPR